MKVLFILNIGLDAPGPSVHILEAIIERALKAGFKAHIIAKRTNKKNPSLPEKLSSYKNLTIDTITIKPVKKKALVRRYLTDVKYSLSCIKYYKKQKDADVVFVQSCNTAALQIQLLNWIVKKPIVYNVQDIWPINAVKINLLKENSLIYNIFCNLQRYAYRNADKIITISEDMKRTLITQEVIEDKVEVIHNWNYTDRIYDIQDKNNVFMIENEIDTEEYKIVYAGNIGKMQNVGIIIEAAELLKEETGIRFYIIGDGASKEKYMKYVNEKKLSNVSFYPMQPSEYALYVYSMADINIIPLFKGVIYTALPSKTAICLSCGKPIVACVDLESEFAKMLQSCDRCAVVDTYDSFGLAKHIKQYYKQDIRSRSNDARNIFKKYFSAQKNIDRYISIFKEAAKSKKN